MGNENKKSVKGFVNEQNTTVRNDKYNKYVKEITPKHNIYLNMMKAFIIGGLICVLGQLLNNWYMSMGADKETAKLYNTVSLVFLAVLFTGFGLYQKLAKFGGAGTLVPITGFANSVAAPAIEYKKEGQVFGIGCKIFTIAGPVILYGICITWLLGLIYYILKCLKIV